MFNDGIEDEVIASACQENPCSRLRARQAMSWVLAWLGCLTRTMGGVQLNGYPDS